MKLINEFSIQLYSLNKEIKKDFNRTLRKISEIGFTGVEFAGYGDINANDMKEILKKLNLKSVGSHISLERLLNNLDEEIEYNKIIGTKYLICPWTEYRTKKEMILLAKQLNEIEEKVKLEGFGFGYHNHDFEFNKDGDQRLIDVLFENTKEVFMELDVFWAKYAGVDPVEYIKKFKNRIKTVHIKQINNMNSKECVDINKGIIDFKEIIEIGKECGVKDFVLEQEKFEIDPYISLENGFNHIMSL